MEGDDVTRAGRRGAVEGRPAGFLRDRLRILLVATALVALALALPKPSLPGAHLQGAAHPVTHVRDARTGDLVAARFTEHQPRTPAWPASGADAEPALALGAILLAGFLVSVARAARPPRRSPGLLPRRRGPPSLAFPR